jgi:hypothetical protein
VFHSSDGSIHFNSSSDRRPVRAVGMGDTQWKISTLHSEEVRARGSNRLPADRRYREESKYSGEEI